MPEISIESIQTKLVGFLNTFSENKGVLRPKLSRSTDLEEQQGWYGGGGGWREGWGSCVSEACWGPSTAITQGQSETSGFGTECNGKLLEGCRQGHDMFRFRL